MGRWEIENWKQHTEKWEGNVLFLFELKIQDLSQQLSSHVAFIRNPSILIFLSHG